MPEKIMCRGVLGCAFRLQPGLLKAGGPEKQGTLDTLGPCGLLWNMLHMSPLGLEFFLQMDT